MRILDWLHRNKSKQTLSMFEKAFERKRLSYWERLCTSCGHTIESHRAGPEQCSWFVCGCEGFSN